MYVSYLFFHPVFSSPSISPRALFSRAQILPFLLLFHLLLILSSLLTSSTPSLTASIPSTRLLDPPEPKTHLSPLFPLPSSPLTNNHVLTLPNRRHPPAPLPHDLLLARPALASGHAQDNILTPSHRRHGDHRLGDLRRQHSPWTAHQHQEARAESRDDPDVRGTHGVFRRHGAEW